MVNHFIKNDEKFLYFKNKRNINGKKPREMNFDESVTYYCNKYNIDKFPVVINNMGKEKNKKE